MTTSTLSGTQKFTRRIPGNLVPVEKTQGRLRRSHRMAGQTHALVAPAFYVGWQEGSEGTTGFSLYTLTKDIPGHSQWSTVSGKTLVDAGFMLPSRATGWEHARSHIHELEPTVEPKRTAA